MAKPKTRKGPSRSRKVRDLAAKPAAKVKAGAPKSKRFSTTMYVEKITFPIKEYDA
jgi:hypothetical protein